MRENGVDMPDPGSGGERPDRRSAAMAATWRRCRRRSRPATTSSRPPSASRRRSTPRCTTSCSSSRSACATTASTSRTRHGPGRRRLDPDRARRHRPGVRRVPGGAGGLPVDPRSDGPSFSVEQRRAGLRAGPPRLAGRAGRAVTRRIPARRAAILVVAVALRRRGRGRLRRPPRHVGGRRHEPAGRHPRHRAVRPSRSSGGR